MHAETEPLPHVRLAGVTKTYGRTVVLDDIELSAERGEFIVVIGRSGSGKSTLLRLIGGLEEPDRGTIAYGNRQLDGMSESERAAFRRREIGFVFQFFNLIPTLTVAENVALPLALNDMPKADADARVAALLDELGLTGSGDRFPEELSGGEQQRVAIARAFATEPKILFADEPTGSLDTRTGEKITELLFDLNARHGTTLILVTHDERLAGRCDRRLSLSAGRMELAA